MVAIINLLTLNIDAIVNDFESLMTDVYNTMGQMVNQGLGLIPEDPFDVDSFTVEERIGALLLEDDMFGVPKLLFVDTSRTEFTNDRIAYLDSLNEKLISTKNIWDSFYFIDAFTGSPNNRFTKITPALNKDSEKNRVRLSLQDFKTLVSNPKFNDNFGEPVIADTIQWYIEQNGAAEVTYRKQGWLADPQNTDGATRAQEININLQLKITEPSGQ